MNEAETTYDGDDTSMSSAADTTGPTPPYISMQTFISMLDKLREHGVPPVFDGSFFGNTSGSTIALHRGTFKSLGLMTDGKKPTPLMYELAEADDERRKELLTEIGRTLYQDVIELGGAKGTNGQLAEAFRAKGITGATVQKAIGFYLSFADYAGYPVSPFFKKGRVASINGGSGAKRSRKKPASGETPASPPANPQGQHHGNRGRTVEEEQKVKYIDLLMTLAKPEDGGQINSDILDRIERMLDVNAPKTKSSSANLQEEDG